MTSGWQEEEKEEDEGEQCKMTTNHYNVDDECSQQSISSLLCNL